MHILQPPSLTPPQILASMGTPQPSSHALQYESAEREDTLVSRSHLRSSTKRVQSKHVKEREERPQQREESTFGYRSPMADARVNWHGLMTKEELEAYKAKRRKFQTKLYVSPEILKEMTQEVNPRRMIKFILGEKDTRGHIEVSFGVGQTLEVTAKIIGHGTSLNGHGFILMIKIVHLRILNSEQTWKDRWIRKQFGEKIPLSEQWKYIGVEIMYEVSHWHCNEWSYNYIWGQMNKDEEKTREVRSGRPRESDLSSLSKTQQKQRIDETARELSTSASGI